MAGPPAKGHLHSNYAKKIVNDLAIARFEGNAKEVEPTQLKECKQGEIMDAREINKMTLAFVLETTDFKPLANNRLFYPDLDSIGKHYLVSTVANPWIKRHYTTCNAMDPLIYDTLVKKLNGDAKDKLD